MCPIGNVLSHLAGVQTPDSPVGIYLSTHNGGFLTRATIDLALAVNKHMGRGRAIVLIHDLARGMGGDFGVKAYRLAEGTVETGKSGKWDASTLSEYSVTPSSALSSLPLNISSPALLTAFLSTLKHPASTTAPSLSSPPVALPPSFSALTNPLATSLKGYLSSTLDALTLHSHEANNVAFLVRQIGREKARQEALIKDREEENVRRKKAGQAELPVPEFRGGAKDPNRLEMLCLQGQVEGLAKGMGAEAGKGLVRCYL